MAVLTTAEKLYTAYLTGNEADFYSGGIRYEFTPDGLKDFITAGSSSVTWDDVTDKPTTFPVVKGSPVANAVDETDVVAQFNSLLASLRTADLLAT